MYDLFRHDKQVFRSWILFYHVFNKNEEASIKQQSIPHLLLDCTRTLALISMSSQQVLACKGHTSSLSSFIFGPRIIT